MSPDVIRDSFHRSFSHRAKVTLNGVHQIILRLVVAAMADPLGQILKIIRRDQVRTEALLVHEETADCAPDKLVGFAFLSGPAHVTSIFEIFMFDLRH